MTGVRTHLLRCHSPARKPLRHDVFPSFFCSFPLTPHYNFSRFYLPPQKDRIKRSSFFYRGSLNSKPPHSSALGGSLTCSFDHLDCVLSFRQLLLFTVFTDNAYLNGFSLPAKNQMYKFGQLLIPYKHTPIVSPPPFLCMVPSHTFPHLFRSSI